MKELNFSNYDIVRKFEKEIAEYAGSKYAVAVDSCTNALFLCCVYHKVRFVSIPRFTYPGVANAIMHAGGRVMFRKYKWDGAYYLQPHNIVDSALRFKKGMYIKDSYYCLSFHYKKHIPIGRGGMILTNSKRACEWFKLARFDGRKEAKLSTENMMMRGWNCYMTPEQATRGLMLFDLIKDKDLPDIYVNEQSYPDLKETGLYK